MRPQVPPPLLQVPVLPPPPSLGLGRGDFLLEKDDDDDDGDDDDEIIIPMIPSTRPNPGLPRSATLVKVSSPGIYEKKMKNETFFRLLCLNKYD
jgi:hypothetical protein